VSHCQDTRSGTRRAPRLGFHAPAHTRAWLKPSANSNRTRVAFTPQVPFFLSHLLFGAAVGGWVYWKLGYASAGIRLQAHRPRLGGAV